ncbi:hypothetical protein GJ744_000039 [Endocarpon pusillum]|uniref:ATP-grasp domain-containing protein n=1 Tax=Endocarpon pusillum TaxID=364733 RepID=A0A8H7E8F9_9EURO|nr:hypothetical protein GJ744_000039 [Endocarpon pusillum]
MLDADSSELLHLAQNVSLILLSVVLLPLSTAILFLSYAVRLLLGENAFRQHSQRSPNFQPKTILVTGVGMAKGLRIAQAFYQTGHRVIGADFEPNSIPVSGRFSRAIDKFYRVSKPSPQHGAARYVRDLVYIVEKEEVDLWVSCSGVASAAEDGQARELLGRKTSCKSIQFDVKTTETLHEKDSFIEYTKSLGLPVPETHQVVSRTAVLNVLNEAIGGKKKYIMKTIGVDDASRANTATVLPKRTLSQTYGHVSKLSISKSTPWVLQQYIKGEEYCTHSIVIDNKVKLFVACPSSDLLMHYQALPQDSGLSKAMLHFTEEFAHRSESGFTGHLSFDFMVEEKVTEGCVQKNIYPIECNPRAHTAVTLFSGTQGSIDMVKAYMSVLDSSPGSGGNGHLYLSYALSDTGSVAYPQPTAPGYYWIGHDIVTLVLHPLLRILTFRIGLWPFIHHVTTFLNHVLFWKEGTYEVWDPLPWWWLYHVYWPGHFWVCLRTGKKWSRVNVSTTKIFGC